MRHSVVIGALALIAAAAHADPGRRAATPTDTTSAERGIPLNGADLCADAPLIGGFGVFPFDNTFANTDGMPHTLCSKNGGAQVALDLWWRWTSPVSGPVTISTCGLTDVDTEIAVYAPNAVCAPGDEALIFCDDQNCNSQTEITFLAVVGQEYLFRVGSFDGLGGANGGPGEFSLSGELSSCEPAICQDFDPASSSGLFSTTSSRVADDFMPADDSFLTFVCFRGDYDSTEPAPGTDDFLVTYYSDNAGVPGVMIASFGQDSGLLLEGPLATGELVKGEYTQFEHKASHPPVAVSGGERVWVEVRNLGDTWYWSSSPDGNSVAYQDALDGYTPDDLVSFDLAFCVGPIETCRTDINNDGFTNFADLNAIISNFNTVCP